MLEVEAPPQGSWVRGSPDASKSRAAHLCLWDQQCLSLALGEVWKECLGGGRGVGLWLKGSGVTWYLGSCEGNFFPWKMHCRASQPAGSTYSVTGLCSFGSMLDNSCDLGWKLSPVDFHSRDDLDLLVHTGGYVYSHTHFSGGGAQICQSAEMF